MAQCEQWAREKGCAEFASDCELTNTASLRFHLGVGFREENRIICFKKRCNMAPPGGNGSASRRRAALFFVLGCDMM